MASPFRAPTVTADSEADCVARIRAGDAHAFEVVFKRLYNPLCVFATHLLGSAAGAEDIVDDVFCRIWQRHDAWEIRVSIKHYLYTAVRNRALEHLARQRRERLWTARATRRAEPVLMAAPAGAADEHLVAAESALIVARALERLPARCREAFVLHRQHGLSYHEIAAVMGISIKTVEKHLVRAVKALRAVWAGLSD